MSVSKPVTKQFADNFEAVAARYRLRELGEDETAKAAARRDLESAETCFAAMANDGPDAPKPAVSRGFGV